tara:strand:- start:281 stop:1207 length:927 start_codon:yes stop_codon:yes gene_type:complete
MGLIALMLKHFSPIHRKLISNQPPHDFTLNHFICYTDDLTKFSYLAIIFDTQISEMKTIQMHPFGGSFSPHEFFPASTINYHDPFYAFHQKAPPSSFTLNEQFGLMHQLKTIQHSPIHLVFFTITDYQNIYYLYQLLSFLFPTASIHVYFISIVIPPEIQKLADDIPNLSLFSFTCSPFSKISSLLGDHTLIDVIFFDMPNIEPRFENFILLLKHRINASTLFFIRPIFSKLNVTLYHDQLLTSVPYSTLKELGQTIEFIDHYKHIFSYLDAPSFNPNYALPLPSNEIIRNTHHSFISFYFSDSSTIR